MREGVLRSGEETVGGEGGAAVVVGGEEGTGMGWDSVLANAIPDFTDASQRTEIVSPAFRNNPTSFSNSMSPLTIAASTTAMRW